LGPQEPHEVRIPPKSKVAQAQLQAGDDPPQKIYPLLGLELTGVALAYEHSIPPHLPYLVAALSLEGMLELAARFSLETSILDVCVGGHERYLPIGRTWYLPDQRPGRLT
jgi:hypothetical protein